MTIIIRPMFEAFKKTIEKTPLVRQSQGDSEDAESNNPKQQPLVITWQNSRARRVSSLTTICVFLTALLVFTTGIIGGAYLYRQFTQDRLRHFREWCSIPYAGPDAVESPSLSLRLSGHNQDEISEMVIKPVFEKFFDEEFDIDPEASQYERIEVPDFSDGRRGRYIHDFAVNQTCIVDLEESRCFILPLNRSLVYPPKSLVDLVRKLRSGLYDVDTEVVRDSYRVVTPAISDLTPLGYYIARECGNFPTYRLERVLSTIVKRFVQENGIKTVFTEFAGAKINQINIVNLASIPSGRN